MSERLQDLDDVLADVITGRPHEVGIGDETLRLYPVTLAKMFVLQRLLDGLEGHQDILKESPYLGCLRLAEECRDQVAEILAVHSTPNTLKDLHDSSGRAMRRALFVSLKAEHLAGLLLHVLTQDKTEELEAHLGIKAERERLQAALDVKREGCKNSLAFGGKSIFGSFIGQLKELGYSDNEILFERGYSYLRLVLADRMTSLYLSDEELERLPRESGGRLLDGDNDADLDVLAAQIARHT